MRKTLVLKIQRRSLAQWLIWCIVVLPFLLYVMFDLFRLPRMVLYVFDICWVGLMVLGMLSKRRTTTREYQIFSACIGIFFFYTAVNYFFNYQSIYYYIWGLRNNFRFYIFFLAVIRYMNRKHIGDFLKMMDTLFWINAILSLVQFYVFKLRGDYTGGLFGSTKGVNAYTIIFMSIVVTKSILMYLRYEEKIEKCVLKVAVSLVVAAHAELKVFFLILVMIIAMSVLITDFSWRKFWIITGGTLAVVVGTTFVGQIFGDGSNAWFNLENMLDLAFSERGYTYSGDLNRLAAIFQINKRFDFTWYEKLFGLGLGNCDTSSVSIFNSVFSERYYSMHHTWFTVAMLYLETGLCGLFQYLGLFAACFILALKKKQKGENALYCMMAMIMAMICCALTPYNASLRTESGYMAYFILALPFVPTRKEPKGHGDITVTEEVHH